MKVYVVADLEGVSGVSGFDVFSPDLPGDVERRNRFLRLWAGEVNAAVRGAVSAGAEEVVVLDNHSSGESLPMDLLDPPARVIHGKGRPSWLPMLDDGFAAVVMVGQHAMVATQAGHLCHTYSRQRIKRVTINGRDAGEIALVAGMASSFGVPSVFVSGDDAAVAEAEDWLPQVTTVAVKQGLSRQSCLSLPATEACAAIESGVRQSLGRTGEISALSLSTPVVLEVEYYFRYSWRVPLKRLLRRRCRRQVRVRGLRRTILSGADLASLWNEFIGAG